MLKLNDEHGNNHDQRRQKDRFDNFPYLDSFENFPFRFIEFVGIVDKYYDNNPKEKDEAEIIGGAEK